MGDYSWLGGGTLSKNSCKSSCKGEPYRTLTVNYIATQNIHLFVSLKTWETLINSGVVGSMVSVQTFPSIILTCTRGYLFISFCDLINLSAIVLSFKIP